LQEGGGCFARMARKREPAQEQSQECRATKNTKCGARTKTIKKAGAFGASAFFYILLYILFI
jgi:hypothetical protein